MPRRKRHNKEPIPFAILGSDHAMNVRFYQRYDESFLYSKVLAFSYLVTEDSATEAIEAIEASLVAHGGDKLPEKFIEAIRAEMFFSALHQCETFFALLIALFQPLPHWLYLTTYETKEIKHAVGMLLAKNIADITGGKLKTMQDFVKVAVYSESVVVDPEIASRWDENINNAVWLIRRIAEFYLKYADAFNSYKHGLRVMVGPFAFRLAPQNLDGSLQGPMRTMYATENALTYLQKESIREVEGEDEIPIITSPSRLLYSGRYEKNTDCSALEHRRRGTPVPAGARAA